MNRAMWRAAVLLLAFAGTATAKVTPEEAARLLPEGDLTPYGAEEQGNASGTIPPWTGGLTTSPPCYKGRGHRYCDPFPQDKPLFVITADNYEEHRKHLSVGQVAMFRKYPKTYKMKVFQTRRTFAAPEHVYKATYENALKAELGSNGEAVLNAVIGIPFPIPKAGNEPIWNHKLRYRGIGGTRTHGQAAVQTNGNFQVVKLKEDFKFNYSTPGIRPDQLNNVSIFFLQRVISPPRLAGTILLVHETMDQVLEPRRAWQYNSGARRLRRAPNVGYDNPGTAADGLRTNDQLDEFNGATDRYTWKIVGKKEMYVPYNSYKVHDDKYRYRDIIQPGHVNQDLPRYELHRVWVVEAHTRPGTSHIYKRRTFYIDEDSWQIVAVDCYDRRDQLWRVQEGHSIVAYDRPFPAPVLETVYDLQNGRYLALAMNNEEPESVELDWPLDHFSPANVTRMATR